MVLSLFNTKVSMPSEAVSTCEIARNCDCYGDLLAVSLGWTAGDFMVGRSECF
jgi:hypothetical protein